MQLSFSWLAEKSDGVGDGNNGGEDGISDKDYRLTGLVFFTLHELRRLLKCGKCWKLMGDDYHRRYFPHTSLNCTLDLGDREAGRAEGVDSMLVAVVMSSEDL